MKAADYGKLSGGLLSCSVSSSTSRKAERMEAIVKKHSEIMSMSSANTVKWKCIEQLEEQSRHQELRRHDEATTGEVTGINK